MFDLEIHRRIILKGFIHLVNVGYKLTESNLEVKNEDFKRDQITVTYQSTARKLTIHYLSNLNYLSEFVDRKPLEYVSINMTNKPVKSELITDHNLNIVHYFRLTLPELYSAELELFNDSEKSGICLAAFETKINRYACLIFKNLKDVLMGKEWISASLTRLDGWRIETEDGVKYYDY